MNRTKGIFLGFLFFAFAAFLAPLAHAAEDSVAFEPQKLWEQVRGDLTVRDMSNYPGQKEIAVDLSGLEPNSVYSVWLSKEGTNDLKGIGVKDHAFRSDAQGKGRFITSIPEGEFERWDTLEVAFHPQGDPKNINNAEIAAKADITHLRR